MPELIFVTFKYLTTSAVKYFFLILLCFGIITGACSQDARLDSQINQTIRGYAAAVMAQNVEQCLGYYENSPDFLVFVNGTAQGYQSFTDTIKVHLPQYRKVVFYFDKLTVRSLADNMAAASGIFHESVTLPDGKELSFKVPATWILIRKNDRWKLIHATAFYQMVSK